MFLLTLLLALNGSFAEEMHISERMRQNPQYRPLTIFNNGPPNYPPAQSTGYGGDPSKGLVKDPENYESAPSIEICEITRRHHRGNVYVSPDLTHYSLKTGNLLLVYKGMVDLHRAIYNFFPGAGIDQLSACMSSGLLSVMKNSSHHMKPPVKNELSQDTANADNLNTDSNSNDTKVGSGSTGSSGRSIGNKSVFLGSGEKPKSNSNGQSKSTDSSSAGSSATAAN